MKWRFQRFLCLLVGLFVRVLYGLRAVNPPSIDGPFILAPNHTSFLDPLTVQLCLRRHVTFLMDGTIYERSALGWFFRFWGAIPIPENRGAAGALKRALKSVRDGRVVGIFPEGRISGDGNLQDGMPGVATLMLRAQVPVIPVAIFGTHEVLPRHAGFVRPGRLLVAFGKPIPPPGEVADKKTASAALRDQVMADIAALQERYRSRA